MEPLDSTDAGRRRQLRPQWPILIQLCAPYGTFFTGTFRGDPTAGEAERAWRRFVADVNLERYGRHWRKRGDRVSWVRAAEFQGRGAIHFHALMDDGTPAPAPAWERAWLEDRWRAHAGFARAEAVTAVGGVAGYLAKYVTKRPAAELAFSSALRPWVSLHGFGRLAGGALVELHLEVLGAGDARSMRAVAVLPGAVAELRLVGSSRIPSGATIELKITVGRRPTGELVLELEAQR